MPNCSENRSYERPQRIHHATQHGLTHGDFGNAACAAHRIAFLQAVRFPHDGCTDIILFQVQHDAHDVARKLQQLTRHGRGQAVNRGNTVTNRKNLPHLFCGNILAIVLNLLANNLANFFCTNLHIDSTSHPEAKPKDLT